MKLPQILVSLIAIPVAVHAADARLAGCETSWRQLYTASDSGGGAHDYGALLHEWSTFEPKCKGTGAYEFRLASLYTAVGQPKLAIDLLSNTEGWPPNYVRLATLARLRAELVLYSSEIPPAMDKMLKLRPQYVEAVADYPDAVAYDQASNYMLMIDDNRTAISYAEKSLQILSDQWDPNRTLTIAHFRQGEYGEAVFAGRRAQELKNSLVKEPEFMYSVAKSFAGVGNIAVAQKTLAILLQEVPNEHGSKGWQDAVEFIKAQIRAGNNKN
jgi:tetratricopeptide (TPR) repeat protein